jgi:hypothetical protein
VAESGQQREAPATEVPKLRLSLASGRKCLDRIAWSLIDRLERARLARRERDASDRRKILVTALPAVSERLAPLFAPMERAAMAVLSKYRDDELALFPDFLTAARGAALMSRLRILPKPAANMKSKNSLFRDAL